MLKKPMQLQEASVVAVFVTDKSGTPMRRVPSVEAIAGLGLAGDRYLLGTGYYSPRDVCQLTLIEEEALESMTTKHRVSVRCGEHRRNIVTRGIRLPSLRGCRFSIGAVIAEYERSRPPCGYLERITEPGMVRAMGEGAGICVSILAGGEIREGDVIRLLPTPASRQFPRLP
jgi:MOSC domain-containing protein YiiM